jgi:hypothetical protein
MIPTTAFVIGYTLTQKIKFMSLPAILMDQQIIKFFEGLGYKVDWDAIGVRGTPYYEVFETDPSQKNITGLIIQFDMGVPLEDLIEDFKCCHLKVPTTSKSDYEVNAPENEASDRFFEKVYNASVAQGRAGHS